MSDELTRTRTRAALADLAEAQGAIADPATLQPDHEEAQAALPELLRAARVALELTADPDPPEPEALDLLADPTNVAAALDAPDPAQHLADLAMRSDAPVSRPEALRRVLRAGHGDEAAPADLVEIADRELRRRERAARRAERLALIEADVDEGAAGKAARERLRAARTALDAVRAMRPVVTVAQHAAPVTDWTGDPPPREWLLDGWLAVGRVHLLTGAGGRGKSRLALQLAAALASTYEAPAAPGERLPEAAWPVPWATKDELRTALPGATVDHPPTLPPTGAVGVPVVVASYASWEDERAEVHRRLQAQPVPVEALGDRLHYVDAAEWGPLWAPVGTAHVQTAGAELTAAGRRLRRLCERVGARLLVIDPLAAAYGSDENVRALVRQYMASWDAWGRAHGCAVLMIAQPPKPPTNATPASEKDRYYSGTTDWPAAARSGWAMFHAPARAAGKGKNGDPARAERTWLECMKANYGTPPDSVYLEADGVTWRAIREPQPEAPAAKANGAGKAPADVDTSEA